MSSQKGPELPPSSPEYQWVASVIRSVEQRTGSPTRWNGRVFEEPNPNYLGTAHPDGSMTVNRASVIEPVKLAYTAGRPLTSDENYRARDAAATVTHEAVHLSSRFGDQNAPGAHPIRDDPARALEEGQAENWTHRNLDNVIADVGLDKAAPGVLNEPSMNAYPAYTHASATLNRDLATRTGQTSDQVGNQLIGTERAQRWNAVADMVIDQRLTGLMPESHRDAVRQQVAAPLRDEFAALPAVSADKSLTSAQKSTMSADAANRGLAGMDREVGRIEQHYNHEYQQLAAQQQQLPSQQQPAQQQAGQQQPGQQQPGQQGSGQGARSGETAVSPDVAKLRAMMNGGQAPAAGAVNPNAAQADGARPNRGGQTPGQQVTRPQTGPKQPTGPERG